MLWIKPLHLFSMVAWFAGLLYLPRLYVYHAQADDRVGIERFKVMERKLFWGIMTPAAALTIGFGAWLWLGYGFAGHWLTAKLALVALVLAHHLWCYLQLRDFARDRSRHGHRYYRWMNEAPAVLLAAIIVLAVVKPF
ncbi:MAG: CopD family protein [bacterium]